MLSFENEKLRSIYFMIRFSGKILIFRPSQKIIFKLSQNYLIFNSNQLFDSIDLITINFDIVFKNLNTIKRYFGGAS